MKTTLVTAPALTPVDISYIKAHIVVEFDTDDFYIDMLIASAIAQVENITNRKLITQTWKAYADEWPDEFFSIPFGTLQSVTNVKYKDTAGVEATLAATEYIVDIASDPGRVVLGYNKTWPTTELYPSNPITIQFVCGYGANQNASVPAPILNAIMLMVSDAYAHRESIVIGQTVESIPGYIMNLLWPYRLWDGFK
jgi:uncharacterized phiE125 gp8 family phage protein